jgi:hypothetical protein
MCPVANPAMPGFCAWAPVPAQASPGSAAARTTVAELMKLYRMLYAKGSMADAARVAQVVERLDPILGRMALGLASTSAACACKTCKCESKDCQCSKGNSSACPCAKACNCKGSTTSARRGGGNRECIGFIFHPGLGGLPIPLPVSVASSEPCPVPAYSQCPVCMPAPVCLPMPTTNELAARLLVSQAYVPSTCVPCPMGTCPIVGPMPLPASTCPVTVPAPCKPAKPIKQSRSGGGGITVTRVTRPQGQIPVCITAVGGRVHISTRAVEAECDRLVTQSAQDRVILEGNVQVEFRTADRPGAIFAELITLGLRDASYEVNCQAGSGMVKVKEKPDAAGCSLEILRTMHQESCPVMPQGHNCSGCPSRW